MVRDSCRTKEEEEAFQLQQHNRQLVQDFIPGIKMKRPETVEELNAESAKQDVYQRTVPQRLADLEYRTDLILERVTAICKHFNISYPDVPKINKTDT